MKHSSFFLCLLVLISFLNGCSNDDDQTEFEQSAYTQPQGITQTDSQGSVIGEADSDDWRSSPFYAGLADIEPAYANPVLYGTNANLDIFLKGTPFTTTLQLGYLDFQNRWTQLDLANNVTDFSAVAFTINPQLFGENAELARGTYRLIVFDGNQRILTYGDLTIE